jgi:hypothetical protein
LIKKLEENFENTYIRILTEISASSTAVTSTIWHVGRFLLGGIVDGRERENCVEISLFSKN